MGSTLARLMKRGQDMRQSLIKNDILKEICKGKVISGGLLASRLGVSRTAVWKAVNALRADGFFIEGGADGYVLSAYNTKLCFEQASQTVGERIVFKETTVSTNEDAKALAETGAREFTLVLSAAQTGGKGRLGRSFFSPEGGLYFSLVLRPEQPIEDCLKITTAAAVSMARAIERVTNEQAKIKWVNDVYVKGKKVCGILTEGAFDAENGKLKYAVLGVGVNVGTPKGGFPEEIKKTAGALFATAAPPSLVIYALLSEFLREFKEFYKNIDTAPHMDEYKKRSMLTGKTVTCEKGGKTFKGRVTGISDKAELIVIWRESNSPRLKRQNLHPSLPQNLKYAGKRGKTEHLSSGEVRITEYE